MIKNIIIQEEVSDEFRSKFRELIKNGKFAEAVSLMGADGLKPLEDVVEQQFIDLLSIPNLTVTGKLMEATGLVPAYDRMQAAYLSSLETGDFDSYEQLEKMTSIKPAVSAQDISRIYTDYLKECQFSHIKQLHILSEISFELSDRSVRKAYQKLVNHGQYHDFEEILTGIEITGIKPSEKLTQKAYAKMLDIDSLHDMERLVELTGIQPKVSEDAAQQRYSAILARDDPSRFCYMSMGLLYRLSGIKPSEDLTHKAYKVAIERRDSFLATTMYNITGIKPNEELHADIFYTLFGVHEDSINRMIGANIPESIIQEVYQKTLDNKHFYGIRKTMELTGIKPQEAMVHEAYSRYGLREIAILREITGIAPKREVTEHILQTI